MSVFGKLSPMKLIMQNVLSRGKGEILGREEALLGEREGKKRDFLLVREGGRSVDLPATIPNPRGWAILQR